MARVHEKLGSSVLPRELEETGLENTPQYDLYKDKMQKEQMSPQLAGELEFSPELGDHYVEAEILLPRGDEVARGHGVAWSHDASENVRGRAHTNLKDVLDRLCWR